MFSREASSSEKSESGSLYTSSVSKQWIKEGKGYPRNLRASPAYPINFPRSSLDPIDPQ